MVTSPAHLSSLVSSRITRFINYFGVHRNVLMTEQGSSPRNLFYRGSGPVGYFTCDKVVSVVDVDGDLIEVVSKESFNRSPDHFVNATVYDRSAQMNIFFGGERLALWWLETLYLQGGGFIIRTCDGDYLPHDPDACYEEMP